LPVLAPVARIAGLLLTTGVIVWAVWLMARSKQPVRGVSYGVRYFLMAALLLLLVLGLHDFGIVLSLRPPTSPVLAFWGFSGVVLALAVLSSARVVDALNLAQNANAELELRIDEKSQQLERFYAAAREHELGRASDTARTHERERMAREMHDGLGAQLITALRGVERGGLSKDEVAEALQDGLDELRLLMDSSDVGRSLHGALAAWRNRWDPRLTAAGLNLVWEVAPGLESAVLSEDAVLQLMRILQEAVTNAMKHAQCDRVAVQVVHEGGMLWLSVTDNGVGIDLNAAPQTAQRGLRHIALRAAQLGAQHSVLPLAAPAQGTQVRVGLRLNLENA
jgi:signal transduction histidine kinase